MKLSDKALEYLNKDILTGCGALQVIDRGTARVIRATDAGVLLYDRISEAFMLIGDLSTETKSWLGGMTGCDLAVIDDAAFIPLLRKKYGLEVLLDCDQYVYTGGAMYYTPTLDIREAADEDMPAIKSSYHKLTDAELALIRRLHNLYCAFDSDGNMVGFIGSHLEGSMGLLNIFPEYRRKGYGSELESFMTNLFISRGLIPYCQVEKGNDRSVALQEKLGFQKAEKRIYWLEKK